MTSTPISSLPQSYRSVPTVSEDMMPQQPLALNDNDIPAYNVTDDMLFGDGIGDAMLNFEEMFDDTNMFDWVRNFLSFFLFFPLLLLFFSLLVPIGKSNAQTFYLFHK
jgi:hypothetical protein